MGRENAIKTAARYEAVAQNLRHMALERGKTADEVAAYLGISRGTYFARLKHPADLTLENIGDAARLFNCKMDDLILGTYRFVRETV